MKIYIAGRASGPYTERFVAASCDAAIEGFKTKFGKDDGFLADGSAWLDNGELVTQPAKSQNYRDLVAVDVQCIMDALQAEMPAEEILLPYDGGLDVFFDAMDDEE